MRTAVSFDMPIGEIMDEWRRLYALSEPNFFLSPPWIETWLGDAPKQVRFGVVKAFDDLRGVFALAIIGAPPRKTVFSFSQARLHETGVGAYDRTYIEYNDVLLARKAPPDARRGMLAAMIDAFPKADEFVLRNVRPEIAAYAEEIAVEREFELRILLAQPTFHVDLDADRDPVLNRFSSSLRSKIRRSIRRYEERGEVILERMANGPDRSVAWTELMRLHEQTWSRRGRDGVFREAEFMGFHERLLDRHPHAIDLVRLSVGGETIGVLYNFIEGGRIYNYQSGFKYESDNQLVPGFVCHALAAERYRQDGYAVYDMMGGDAEYKRRMGAEGEVLQTLAITRRGLRSTARSLAASLRRVGSGETRQT